MATTVSLQKQVSPELKEYVALREITAINDVLEMQFDEPIQLEQLTVNTTLSYKVWIVYPGSEMELTILNTVGSKSTNSRESMNRGRMWYRLPAHAKVKLEIDATPSTEVLSMTAIGSPM